MTTGTYTLSIQGFADVSGVLDFTSPRPLLGYVLRNYERAGVSRPTQIGSPITVLGLPDTNKLINSTFVPLTEPLQRYWYGLLRAYAPPSWTDAQVKGAWKSLTYGGRAFTNGHGWNNGYADYINGVNLGAQPMGYEPIVTGGNVVELVSTAKYSVGGHVCYKINVLDTNISPTTYQDMRWFVQWATISRREGYNSTTGKWTREDREMRFPQLGGANNVPVPLFTKGGKNYIDVTRVRVLTSSDPIPYPYV